MTFSEKVPELWKQNNFSREELAEKLGVSRRAISRWESGDTMPDSPNLLQISKIFSASADYLLRNKIERNLPEPRTEKPKAKKKKPFFKQKTAFSLFYPKTYCIMLR